MTTILKSLGILAFLYCSTVAAQSVMPGRVTMSDFAWEEQGTMQAFVAAALFATNEGVGKIGLRQLLLGILSAYSESEDVPGSLISPHEARAILADGGVELVIPEPPSTNEHLPVPHQDVPIDEEVAQVLGEVLQPNESRPPTLDDLLKSLQPMLAKSLSPDESKLPLERQLRLYLWRAGGPINPSHD